MVMGAIAFDKPSLMAEDRTNISGLVSGGVAEAFNEDELEGEALSAIFVISELSRQVV